MLGQSDPKRKMPVSGDYVSDGVSPGIVVVFRNDDVSAVSDVEHERRVISVFERYGVSQTLGVVPNTCPLSEYHRPGGTLHFSLRSNPVVVDFLRRVADGGNEIAIHGYTHRANRLSMPARRDFKEFRGLSLEEQSRMVAAGVEEIGQALGVRTRTFIPPWNRSDQATASACQANGVPIISAGPYTPVVNGIVAVGSNCDIDAFPQLINKLKTSHSSVLVVVCYHSRMIQTRDHFDALDRAVKVAAESSACRVMTIADVAATHSELAFQANAAAMNAVHQSEVLETERARSVVYRKCLCFAGRPDRVESLLAEADGYYRAGHYAGAVSLTAEIDRAAGSLLNRFRSYLGVLAACLGALAAVACLRIWPAAWLGLMAIIAIVAASPGSLAWWLSTARGTRVEMAWVAVLMGTCAVLGFAAFGIARAMLS